MIRILLLLCLIATPAQALFFSGTVEGTVTTVDTRDDPYDRAGFGATNDPLNGNLTHFRQASKFNSRVVPVPEALIEVCVILVGNTSCDTQWTRTDSAGRYAVPWWGWTSAFSIWVKVYAIRPQLDEGQVVISDDFPAHEFRITTAGFSNVNIGEANKFSITASLGDTQTINVRTGSGAREVANTYLTARETYAMLDTQTTPKIGGKIRSDMQGVSIFANHTPFDDGGGGGLAFLDSEVWLTPSTGTSRPFTVAHELGHITAWRAMDWWHAPYELSSYSYGGDTSLTWRRLSNEYERPAFWEGFASSVAAMWMWKSNANPTPLEGDCVGYGTNPGIPLSGCLSLENPDNGCGAGVPGHRRAMCVTRAFWDILDDPPGASNDPLTYRDFGEIITVFRKQYPRICAPFFDNGCRDEGGYDDNNWKDYKRNHIKEYPNDSDELNDIEAANDLQGGNDE